MYKVRSVSKLITKMYQPIHLEIPKRTKKLEAGCDLPPCDDQPFRPKTGVLILHPGEATSTDEINAYLKRVKSDQTYRVSVPSISSESGWRSEKQVCAQYEQIGGHSPLLQWAKKLASIIEKRLEVELRPFAPYKVLVGFRYASPLVTKALKDFKIHNVKHLVIFSLEPHYFCQKTSPCYDGIYKYYKKHDIPKWTWTVADRWGMSYILGGVYAQTIKLELDQLPPDKRREALIIFVANGPSREDVKKGDLYLYEVGATVHTTMRILNFCNDFTLTWLPPASINEPIRPLFEETLCKSYQDGRRAFIVVPVSWICDCLDTLYEIDVAVIHKYRELWGCEAHLMRAPTPNDHKFLINAMVSEIKTAMEHEVRGSAKFLSQCHGCKLVTCDNQRKFFKKVLQ